MLHHKAEILCNKIIIVSLIVDMCAKPVRGDMLWLKSILQSNQVKRSRR